MSMMASIKNLFGGKETPREALDFDDGGKQLYKEDILQFVAEELNKRKLERQPLEYQWTLNSNFLAGNQYCDINPYRGGVEQLSPVYDWLERESFNRIAPLIETRIANLKKINYRMSVKPRTNELDDYAKAETATAVLRYQQQELDFDTKKNTMILWNELCGSCFWLSWWDKDKGEEYARTRTAETAEDGTEYIKERAVYEGDLDCGLLTPYEVYPESIFRQNVSDQRSMMIEQVKTVGEIYDLYGIEVEEKEIETFCLMPTPVNGGYGYEGTVNIIGHKSVSGCEKVVTYFERPNRERPDGRMIIVVGEQELVYYGPLPYRRIPIVQVVCKEIAGQFFGKSAIEDLIPLQRAYNGCVNRIHEYIKNVAIGSYIVEEGSIDIEEYEQNGKAPGAMLVYKNGMSPPVPVPNGQLPMTILQEKHDLQQEMEYAAAVSQLMVIGAAPSGVTSGVAIDSLREIDNTRLSLTGDHIRNSVRDLARLWLEIFKRYARSNRVLKCVGTNSMGNVLIWSADDINSYDVVYDTENELLLSEEMQKQRFFEAFQLGLFTDAEGRIPQRFKQRALELMKVGNYTELMSLNQLQIQAAQRENSFFENGALPQVGEFDDHEIHVEEHLRYILQMRFELLRQKKPTYAKALEAHVQQHKNAAAQMEAEKIRKAMAMRGGGGME